MAIPQTQIWEVRSDTGSAINGGGGFRLNNAAGGGGAIRGIAVPNALPGSAVAKSFGDLGVLTNGNLLVFS